MKKIIWIFAVVCFLSLGYTSAATFDSSILKVNVYRYMEGTKFFRPEQYGSALYIGSGNIITNSHVILDENTNEPFDTIEICGSVSSGTNLKCGILAKVVAYDPDVDLALLHVDQSLSLTPIKFAKQDPKTSDRILIKWYPRDGFSTLTQTEGNVGGVYNDYYKIDASINGGNSGGGGFDSKFALVGIPTFKASEGANIGYIIPVSVVKDFLQGKGNIIPYQTVTVDWFQSYINSINALKSKKTIWDKAFSFSLPAGFKVNEVNISDQLFNYEIINRKLNVSVSLSNKQLIGTFDIHHYLQNLYDQNKNDADKTTTGQIMYNKLTRSTFRLESKWIVSMTYYTIVGNNLFSMSIAGDSKNSDFTKALSWYKNITFQWLGKEILPSSLVWNTLVFPSNPKLLFMRSIDDTYSWFSLKDISLDIDIPGIKKNISTNSEAYYPSLYMEKLEDADLVDKTPEEILNIDNYAIDVDTTKWLVKNSLWSIFYIEKMKSTEGDYVIYVEGFTTIGIDKYAFTIEYNVGTQSALLDDIVKYIDTFKILWDSSFIEWTDTPISLTDLFSWKKTSGTKDIDASKFTFHDYTDYTIKKLSREQRLRIDEANKQGNAYLKLVDTPPTYSTNTDYAIKWYAENLKSVSIVLWNEDGVVAQVLDIALNKDNPSGLYNLTLPKNIQWALLVWIEGITTKDQSVRDYSDMLIMSR